MSSLAFPHLLQTIDTLGSLENGRNNGERVLELTIPTTSEVGRGIFIGPKAGGKTVDKNNGQLFCLDAAFWDDIICCPFH